MFILSPLLLLGIWLQLDSPISEISNLISNLQITPLHDTYLTPTQMIKENDYPAESHIAKTKDGYLLELHRIPYGKEGKTQNPRIPVLLFHGFLYSSVVWILNGPEKSLAYRLADEGYDVWMGNVRGDAYSKAHVKYTPAQRAFWDFSYDDIALNDLPATIDYILNVTNFRRLHYVGHSAGNLIMYYLTATLPEYNDKINAAVSLAPPLAIPHTKSPLFLLLVPVRGLLEVLYDVDIRGSFEEPDIFIEILDKYVCTIDILGWNLCGIFNLMFSGWDPAQFNETMTPLIMKTMPSGTSLKCILHVLQLIDPGVPAFYDYGEKENLKRYGTSTPPLYNTANIQVPVKVYYGGKDLVVTPTDAETVHKVLPNTFGLVKIDQFDHMDFFSAIDINPLLNDNVIETINNITNSISNSFSNTGAPSESPRLQSANNVNDLAEQSPNNAIGPQGSGLTTNEVMQFQTSIPSHENYSSPSEITLPIS